MRVRADRQRSDNGRGRGDRQVATPPLSVPVPRMVAPSLNVTVPVGVPRRG